MARLESISKSKRESVMEECGYRCFYCEERLTGDEGTMDHIVPLR